MKRFIVIMIIGLTLLQAQVPEKIKSKSLPLGIGLSAVLPGAGQWYSGHKGMAIMYIALEAAFITGMAYFNHQGALDIEAYEDFADAHWDVGLWVNKYNPTIDPTTHRAVVYVDNRSYSPEVESDYELMITDIQNGCEDLRIQKDYHFYENIGKYQQFKKGWDDWVAGEEVPGDPLNDIYARYSDNQYNYAEMRREANVILDIGTYFATAIFLNHFISAIDAGFRIKKGNENRDILITLHTTPTISQNGTAGLQTGLSVTF
ncbi:MAG: hypothetical protein K9N05_03230 [Candidatus Marinimicrobia bacterium]|nr:hypothetical protein [Candidatus Neomarinimicrobiota bacterium]